MDEAPNIREYLNVVKRHKVVILAILVLVMAVALTFNYLQPPKYTAEAQVLVQPITISLDQANETDLLNLETEVLIATSPRVAQVAADRLEESEPLSLLNNLEVTVAPDADVLIFTYTGGQARTVQQRAQAFASAYVEDRTSEAQERIETAAAAIQSVLDKLEDRLDLLNAQLDLSPDPEQETGAINEIDTLNQQLVFERTRLLQLAEPEHAQAAQLLYQAQLPQAPSNPTPVSTGLIGLIVGLALGLASAFLRERLDDRLEGRSSLEVAINAPVLGVVPRVPAWKSSQEAYLATAEEPHSVASEAYRTLRTAILFTASQYEINSLLITSANEKEGKSATSANLAVVLGQAGKRVIVVSGDLRKPRLQTFFKVQDKRKGLTNLLAGEVTLDEVLMPVNPSPGNVRLLHSGPIPGNPTELLGSDAMRDVMKQLRDRADFVIVDTAPILAVADAMTLARRCDRVLFVADAARSSQGAVVQAREQLEQVGAKILGGVLHNFDQSKSLAYTGQVETPYAYAEEKRPSRLSLRIKQWSKAKG